MGVLIEWRKIQPEHTGSTELNGVVDRPMIYVHPRDNSDPNVQARKSRAVRWAYNHGDLAQSPVQASMLEVLVEGNASYELYRQSRLRWIAAGTQPATFEEQEAADEVFSSPNPATNLQSSGSGTYEAWLRFDPHQAQDGRVSLTATVDLGVRTNGSPQSAYGDQRMLATATLWKGSQPADALRSMRLIAITKVGQDQKTDQHVETYTVTVPAGGFVKIGSASVGPGFEISAGSNTFRASAKISYTPHRQLQADSIHAGCQHIDPDAVESGTSGSSGSGH
ncbi:MAG: hypothetical protein ACT4UP_09365 [Gammaproteobacteria bacterium]